ncbi:MAG: methyltransferase domain-containing protein [Alphaproteobacteria bacterium]|nr:methyltransferase domain-containing protein [Alphaproteobacteria bacterium]MBU1516271.1 methyltransferase domain-containing protein [Alphaproteobacteria bacterium]MBU2093111.1 methyltransferase domain-containing protein [Alphaproteobacteria bacterium]MBU2151547.1 methyltransferase domain-containing protein [Alphaproteobacteria bacterium]MBU2306516.1 methyltransferase domain-containing protein [Alphaproteobacteria bacterium]
MRPVLFIVAGAALLLGGAAQAQPKVPPVIAAAVADAGRPAIDTFRDDRRKPAETVAFAGVREGMSVAELIPGNGYYTRILSKVVGPKGHVYTVPFSEPRASYSKAIAADPAYANVTLLSGAPLSIPVPQPVDLVWTTQNYHDIRQGRALLNKAVFDALKPGGIYFVVDHSAVAGADEGVLLSLHRIDEALVKREVLAAGFVLDAESDLLRNPSDKRNQMVFDREVNRNTDQFVLKFRKPAQ